MRLHAAKHDTIQIDSARAITVVFALSNDGDNDATLSPALVVPTGWSALNATTTLKLAPRSTDTWLVSVSTPTNAPAGVYAIGARISASGPVSDSVFVHVLEHRALEVLPMDVPGWVVAGGDYQARFIVRNRGNVAMTVALSGTTTRGRRCVVDVPSATLAPGATTMATVRVIGAPQTSRTSDDVVELTAVDVRDASTRVSMGARTTIVPQGNAVDDRATIPAELALRAMSPGAGVSTATFTSAGLLGDGKTWADLSYRSRPKVQSTYGEREEMHAAIRRDALSARLGDGLYGFSTLTSQSVLGFGGSVEGRVAGVNAGAYAERSRYGFNQPLEIGAFAGSARDAARGMYGTVVARQMANGMSSEVASVTSRVELPGNGRLSIEVAGSSDSASRTAMAERVRATGTVGALTYDAGHARGGDTFAGWQRGIMQQDALLTWSASRRLTFSTSAQTSLSTPPPGTQLVAGQRFTNMVAGGNVAGLLTLDYVRTMRSDYSTGGMRGTQQGLRATTSIPAGPLQFSASYDGGMVDELTSGLHRSYQTVSGSTRISFGNGRGITIFGDYGDGRSLGADARAIVSGGMNAQIRLPLGVDFTMLATGSSLAPRDGEGRLTYGQLDAQLDRKMMNGATLSVRTHLWENGRAQGATQNQLLYVEVRAPLHLPVGRPNYGRRVEGRVVDAKTGEPVAGTLVRVGDQAAVTDKKGRVTLAGLRAGRYPISVEASGANARPLVEGDLAVEVAPNASKPATFVVQLAEAGRVRGAVRKLGFASSLSADSLVDEGVQANVLVALEGARDTLYQTSDDRGRVDFGSVPVGAWTVAVRADDPSAAARVPVTVLAGATHNVDLKVTPQRRAVTFVGGGEIKAHGTSVKYNKDQKQQDPQRDPR